MKSRAIVLQAELQKQLSSAVGFKFNILPECSNLENKGEQLYMNSDSPSAEGYPTWLLLASKVESWEEGYKVN